ncbi:MAG: LexA family transcriptional regulator [Clostridiaceae bacterium]|nr:LexA family transcriptional regulator [Clostridiaceae bacterium]
MSEIRDIRKRTGLSQKEFGELLHVDQTTVSKWEKEISMPDLNLGLKISEKFGISLDKIYRNPLSFEKLSFPVYRQYLPESCESSVIDDEVSFDTGYKELAYFLSEVPFAQRMFSDREILDSFFAVRISGNEMEPRFCSGDIVLIEKGNEEYDGQICAACVEGAPARLFRLTRHKNGISLLSLNPVCEPIFVPRSELERGKTVIVGRAVGLRGIIR